MADILSLTPQVPFPPRQGTALRNWGILQGLAAEHRVSLLTFAAADQASAPPAPLEAATERVAIVPQPVRSMRTRLRDLLTNPRPDLTLRLDTVAFRAQLETWLATYDFDWIMVEGLELAGYLDAVWSRPSPPRVIFDDHNCEYLLQKRAFMTDLRHPPRWIGAAYSFVQWLRLRRYEAAICQRADLVVAVSEADAQALERIGPDLEPLVVPNGVDVATFSTFTDEAPLEQPAFVFTGTMDFRPNVDGVLWFAHEVWPRIRAELPRACFYIVGRHPHDRLACLRDVPGIVITGSVPDTRPYIKGALVYVVPLLVGGGTRLKLLESTAMGKAIVSTTLGAEGFERPEDVMALADDPVAFAAACVYLARNTPARSQLGKRAQAFAENYDWSALLPPLLEKIASTST